MTLRSIAIEWYRRAFGAPAGSDIRDEGFETVLDGNTAVALAEAGITNHAVLGSSMPADAADSVWLGELESGHTNLYGEALYAQTAEGPRGIVAAATGLALAGRRATAFLSGQDIAATQDLLISAAGKHVPLVLHLVARAATSHGSALGSGHGTAHLSADSGFFMLIAANVQEAVDFTYIARRVAEEALVPGMVVMDSEQTALAVQDVCLLSPAQVSGFLGPSRELIESPTTAQKLLFGETRRRVPAWHDLDEPVLTGSLFGAETFALGAFARGPYFDAFVAESLAGAFDQFAARTGRHYESVSRYKLDDAKTVLLAQGAAIETARVAADCLRKEHKIRAGVLGIHALRPFPGERIAAALEERDAVFVLERLQAPMSGEPPLSREVRANLGQSQKNRRTDCHPVLFGIGGLPLRVVDLVELCTTTELRSLSPLYLGISFDDTSGEQPKREVLLDALRRDYPGVASQGIRAGGDAHSAKQPGSLNILVRGGDGEEDVHGRAGALLHRLEGGRVRSRPAVSWTQGGNQREDWVVHGDDTLHDPGDGTAPDVTLDLSSGEITLERESKRYRAPLENIGNKPEYLLGALFGVLTSAGTLDARTRRVIASRESMLEGVDAGRRDELLAAFRAGLENVAELDVGEAAEATSRWEGDVPEAVRHLGRNDEHYASLPRFWDQIGVLHRDGLSERLTAGPYLATGTMPPLSSTFNDLSASRETLPVFDPAPCTGCGKCWTHCPDSAIGVVAATPVALIDAGIKLTGAEAVRQVAPKLASRIISANKSAESAPSSFREMIDDAFGWLEGKMPLPDERKQAINDGLGKIRDEIGALPVAITEAFFNRPEARSKDSAELLSLAINPDACKACDICIKVCEPEALTAAAQNVESLERARALWATWGRTPDTGSETIERAAEDNDVGKLPALLLSRYCQFALAGGDPAEAGSGEKMATRLLLSATEFHQQPLVQRFAQALSEARDAVSSLVTETLSGTLPVEDMDAITEQLQRTTTPRVDLKTLAEATGSGDHSVDTTHLLGLIDLLNKLDKAHHRLVRGDHGLGRARYGLAVAGGSAANWAGAFPHNPFQAPVLIDMSGDAAQLAAGLVEAHLDETTDLVRLLRLARLEIEQPDGIEWQREALASLRWGDLTAEEYELCPPLVLVGSDEMLAGRGLGQLVWLLNSGLPVKVLVLKALDFADKAANRADLDLIAIAQRKAYVALTSVAHPAHLGDSMLEALAFDGPALIQVYAPSPTRHGFPSEDALRQAELAVTSRVTPLFRYDPAAAGVFGSRISLDGNPLPHETMVPHEESPLTPADWAIGQGRFECHFEPLADNAPTPTVVHEYLQLDTQGRTRKTPYVMKGEQRYAMTPAVIAWSKKCLDTWRTLQELAGIVTPFTEQLEQDIRAELAAGHQAELDAQQKAADEKIQAMQQKTETEIASKIRSRLMQLAARKRD